MESPSTSTGSGSSTLIRSRSLWALQLCAAVFGFEVQAKKHKLGRGLDATASLGPLFSADHRKRVMDSTRYIERGLRYDFEQ